MAELTLEAYERMRERAQWAENAYRLLATEMIFEGNSVQHWHAKAEAYKGIVFAVCNAFRDLGYQGEFGDLHTLPQRLREFVDTFKKKGTPDGKS